MGPSDTGPPWPLLLLALSAVVKPGGATARYRGLYTNDLSEAYETIPKKVSPLGEHISHDVTTYHEHDDDHVHFNVSIGGIQHLLALKPSNAFIAPSVVVERRGKDLHTRSRVKRESSRCHFHGVVDGQPGSRVAVSTCNGLSGVIHSKHGKYYIEPSHHPMKTVTPGHKHLVYKRSAVISSYPKKKRKKKRRKQSNCGTREPRKLTLLEWQSQLGKLKVQEKTHKHKDKVKISKLKQSDMKKLMYRKVKSKNRRSISTEHFVETLIVADSSMVEFHQEGDIETYILTLMNMVSSLYLDPSIGNSVQVVVVKIILLDDQFAEPGLNVTTNADTTLRHFCKWQVALNPGDDSHPHHHDAAILITRKDICARQDTPCGTLGVAHIGGMCKVGRSCSVNEDNGITSAHTIAHEMGHNFGMLHDTEKTGCKRRRGSILHIMTPSFEADTITVSWSECSRREITRFLDKGLGKCLQDPPREMEKYEYPELPAGAMYNGDHQCRLQFGSDATVCSPLDEICSRLWCSINDTCTTLLKPAAAGTSCGKHKWCQEQRCVPMMEPPAAIDGGWGDWGPWSPCTRTCGAGVSVRERECDHPRPAAGGRFCVGERRRYKICNTHPCPAGQPTFRAAQCSAYNDHPYEGRRYEWQPYFDQGEPCQLYCSDANETVIVPWGDYAIDGTPCSVVSRDICISGICKKVGCDWVVDSTAKEDDCGICQGDGTKCDKVQGEYMKQSRSPGYREIAFIPRGARNVRIEEMGHSENYISIGSALSRKFYLNGKRHITLPGEYTVAGTQALYERDNQMEKIRIPGPVLEPIVVYIYFRGKVHNPGVEYKYSIWKPDTTTEVRYSWILGDWSPCSATCGGGFQRRLPVCQESTVTSAASEMERPHTVDDSKCASKDKPKKLERKCNENPCPYHWWVGPWQACPVSCSEKGKKPSQRRSVMCVDAHEMALPDHFCDKKMKPHEYQPCKHLPSCDPLG